LRRTLECIAMQTYPNLEIIVSDNASTGGETEYVVRELMACDQRIQYYRQSENRGPLFNFKFVLEKASGEYFMWAADDDAWDARFVNTLMHRFSTCDPSIVAVASEAQYTVGGEQQPFFSEGSPFYSELYCSPFERVRHVIKFNYGNLFYSIFKKNSLFKNGKTVFDLIGIDSLNEIPIFAHVAEKGNWIVLPDVLFYKETSRGTYLRAKWEMQGGRGPKRSLRYALSLAKSIGYHLKALRAINKIISELESVTHEEKRTLSKIATLQLMKHFSQLVINSKKFQVVICLLVFHGNSVKLS
jgi:glycosyltransferase involved in cell wall biosynthesis